MNGTRDTLTCQVLVVGAGVAGVPAAIAAARAGADTILAEKRNFPGGTGVVGMHRHICGLYGNGATPELLNGGLVGEVCGRLRERAPDLRPIRLGKVHLLPYAPGYLQSVFSDLLGAETRLRVFFGSEVRGVQMESGRITAVMTDQYEITPRVVVDCSGDGVVIQCSPLLHEPAAGNCQLAGYVIRLTGLDTSDDMLPIKVPYAMRRAVDEGALPGTLKFTTFTPGDSRDEASGSRGSIRSRKRMCWPRGNFPMAWRKVPGPSSCGIPSVGRPTVIRSPGRHVTFPCGV